MIDSRNHLLRQVSHQKPTCYMLFNELVSLGSFLFVLRLRQYAIVGPWAGHGVQHHSCLRYGICRRLPSIRNVPVPVGGGRGYCPACCMTPMMSTWRQTSSMRPVARSTLECSQYRRKHRRPANRNHLTICSHPDSIQTEFAMYRAFMTVGCFLYPLKL